MPGVVYPLQADAERYAQASILGTETLDQAFGRIARTFPDRVAISEPGLTISYRELDELTDRVAAGLLALGLEPLDRVVFQLANSKELIISFIACFKANLIPICTLAAHRKLEIGFLAAHAKARAHIIANDDPKFDYVEFARTIQREVPSMKHIVVAKGSVADTQADVVPFARLIERNDVQSARQRLAGVERDPYQVGVFQLSGGTSGVPKIIPRFHNEYLNQILDVVRFHGLDENTIAFTPNPLLHNAPIICYWGPALWNGGEVAVCPSRQPEDIARFLRERRPNWLCIPMPILAGLNAAGVVDASLFRHVKAFTVPSAAGVVNKITGAVALPLFGMTEGFIAYNRAGDSAAAIAGTVGRPIGPMDEYRIVKPETNEPVAVGEAGEFCCRGPSVIRGYYDSEERNREAFTSDGFYRSGDLMRERLIDGKRYLVFEGRIKDVVSRGGEKINCQEVERVAIQHPKIAAVSIVPMPDPIYGERACAFVIPKGTAPTVRELGDFLVEAGLAKFKCPERIEAISELPLTSAGKISKPRLKEILAGIMASEVKPADKATG
ncbi:MAG: AMP-binding protein [Alphaproteobacteria bacterium]